MRIINIITVLKGVVETAESFLIAEEQLSDEVVELAEKKFTELITQHGVAEEDVETYIEDGYYQEGDWSANIVWTYPEGI